MPEQWVEVADANLRRGWSGPIPIGREHNGRFKLPWVPGLHGFEGTDAPAWDWNDLIDGAQRCRRSCPGILALGERLPVGVLGIDVDAYEGKLGASTVANWEARFGPLPATYRVTARDDGVSGIRLYRVPRGFYPKETAGSGVEFLDHHHRYMAVPPSWHHTGHRYRLYLPNGTCSKTGYLPPVKRIPELPRTYLDGLPPRLTEAGSGSAAADSEVAEFAARYHDGPQAEAVLWLLKQTVEAPDCDSVRNAARDALCWAAREAKGGRYGWGNAVDNITTATERAYAARGRLLDTADFDRLVRFAVGQVRDTPEKELRNAWQTPAVTASPAPAPAPPPQPSLWPEPGDPRKVALHVIATAENSGSPLRYWNTLWFRWCSTHYRRLAVEDVRDELYEMLADATYTDVRGNAQPWKPTESKLNQVIDAMRGVSKIGSHNQPPCWTDGRSTGTLIPCANGLLRMSDRVLMACNALYFNLFAVPYRYDPEAQCPRWRRFLTEVFGEDIESVQLLQDWFYYVLTGRTDLHKMLLWIGPKRGGKGTVSRVLKELIGAEAYIGLSAETVGRQFGLQGAIHKSLGVFPDEDQVDRASGKRLVAFIKNVTGEDDVAVDIKNKEPWNGRLPIRFMYHSNQMPVLPDPSGAVFSRLLVIQTTSTFLGREDPGLESTLMQELPGILNWALDAQLAQRQRFVQPASSADLLGEVDSYSNPVREFLLERAKFGEAETAPAKRVYTEFDKWRHANGLTSHGDSRWFGRSLRAAMLDLSPHFFSRKQHDNEAGRPWYYHGLSLLPAVAEGETRRVLRAVPNPPSDPDRGEVDEA